MVFDSKINFDLFTNLETFSLTSIAMLEKLYLQSKPRVKVSI
jgi:hypothetical protein